MKRSALLVVLSLMLIIMAGCRNTARPATNQETVTQPAEESFAAESANENSPDPIDSEEEPVAMPEILAELTDVPPGSCFTMSECPRIRFTCADGLASFDNSGTDSCWCGCMTPAGTVEEIPTEDSGDVSFDPTVEYPLFLPPEEPL